MTTLNETHDPALASWVESANGGASDFPIQNLPFGIFRRRGSQEAWRGGVAIGDQILDLAAAHGVGVFSADAARAAAACGEASLNTFMEMGPAAWSGMRLALSRACGAARHWPTSCAAARVAGAGRVRSAGQDR